ncbi:myocardin-related transcription factor B isoform X2 [Denticeps clupeoides]|uniref:SAP domain-containing protein n=1 Tax=Denticeps clupeoides TaxID=299321 RepID=A0AAY4CPX8_9TELE|nr:myocardin-related transcription factor B-like isoform X2 [Denticeps clupeoides]
MGLQARPHAEPALTSMACLEVETPALGRGKFKSVLQLRLQQRRTREQLVDQGIMPPLKSPAAFHEQIRSLERARTESFLKHKLCTRPERSELVRMHILEETQAEPSLQATQMKLKRARLADNLNEKIAQRPGPMELVEKNILPVDTNVKEAIIDGDVYNFDEDSNDALSPEQPASQESQGSAPSPKDISASPPTTSIVPSLSLVPSEEATNSRPTVTLQCVTTMAPTKPAPTLVKHSQPKAPSDKSRSKKSKEPRPRVKKLKYHQYIPPDQKQEANKAPMDSAYARLLQQQQQFLQLQIISQQQQHYNYQTILPAPLKPAAEGPTACSNVGLSSSIALSAPIVVSVPGAAPARQYHTLTNRKPGPLPANLDEMKVAELKIELKLRGLPVSGTKTDLIERLKPFQEGSGGTQPGVAMELMAPTASLQFENSSSSPPVSPVHSEISSTSMEEAGFAESSSRSFQGTPSPGMSAMRMSPNKVPMEDVTMETRVIEKDQRLHEKERQIEELMRKLEKQQSLVEELKMQLEVEKRNQQTGQRPEPSPPHSPLSTFTVKEESGTTASCSIIQLAGIKQEEPQVSHQVPHIFISHQQVPQVPHALLTSQPGAQILLPVSTMPTSIQLPNTSNITAQAQHTVASAATGLPQTSLLQHQKTETSPRQQSTPATAQNGPAFHYRPIQNQPAAEVPQRFLSSSPESRSPAQNSPNHMAHNGPLTKAPSPCPPSYILQPSTFSSLSPKNKDPPRYEEAVKQTRSLQAPIQVPTATSQHMDDLFDVLIESGEIPPIIKQDPQSLDKLLPVTANVTTLPINTVLSRPPPQVQVARPPLLVPESPAPSLLALATDNQLESFLEGTLSGGTEPRALRLMEELHSHLLEQPHSPMDMSELSFTSPTIHLQDGNLDNMEWLDLTMPVPTGVSPPTGVFSSDFLDPHDLQLHWD